MSTTVFDDIATAALVAQIEAEAARVRKEYGDGAFEIDRTATAHHEAGHAVVGCAEGIKITKVEAFFEPRVGLAAGAGASGWLYGLVHSRGWRWTPVADAKTTLAEARVTLSGRMAELACPSGRMGAAIDELVFARWLSDQAAQKIGADPERIWRVEVRGRTRRIIRLNRDVVDAIADRLVVVGRIRGDRLREILSGVRRLP